MFYRLWRELEDVALPSKELFCDGDYKGVPHRQWRGTSLHYIWQRWSHYKRDCHSFAFFLGLPRACLCQHHTWSYGKCVLIGTIYFCGGILSARYCCKINYYWNWSLSGGFHHFFHVHISCWNFTNPEVGTLPTHIHGFISVSVFQITSLINRENVITLLHILD